MEDWRSITVSNLKDVGVKALTKSELLQLLRERYLEYEWKGSNKETLRGRYAHKKRLARTLAALFPVTDEVIS